jgi:hypothetical protein
VKRVVLSLLVLSCLAIGAGYAAAFLPGGVRSWAPWCLALGTNGMLMSLMALGALRRGRLAPSLQWTFAGMFALCSGAFAAALWLPPNEGAGGPLLLGLPLRSAIVLYGIGVAPILVLPLVWARTFESSTLSDEDLRRLRETHEAMTRIERERARESSTGR